MTGAEEIVERIRAHCDNGLRYYASALNKLRSGEWKPSHKPAEDEERELSNAIYSLANVLVLIEGAPSPREALLAREEVMERYLRITRDDPWKPGPAIDPTSG